MVDVAASSDVTDRLTNGPRREAVEIRGLTKRFGRTTVLNNVDLTVAPGEIHALVGQNGSGKSTLIKILSGIYTADAGEISVAASRSRLRCARLTCAATAWPSSIRTWAWSLTSAS